MTEKLSGINKETRHLVRVAAAVAGAGEQKMRAVIEAAAGKVNPVAMDEVILQSYLFAGFPRALNAARMWRAASGEMAPEDDAAAELKNDSDWVERGVETCRTVYGGSYELLRENIRALHPALDSWMIADGYGKVLSRPELDLKTRELCIVAACAAAGQQRQLHSHLHGALNSGASTDEIHGALDSLADLVAPGDLARYRALLSHVLKRRHPPGIRETGDVH
ncbi:MAG: carboxymuconolactone decarboxylase family protein [Gemmatimonadaceae bacterium]